MMKVLAYNVHGNLFKKLKDNDFLKYLKQQEIIMLMETRVQEENLELKELEEEWVYRSEKAVKLEKMGRASGGILITTVNGRNDMEFKRRVEKTFRDEGIDNKTTEEKLEAIKK